MTDNGKLGDLVEFVFALISHWWFWAAGLLTLLGVWQFFYQKPLPAYLAYLEQARLVTIFLLILAAAFSVYREQEQCITQLKQQIQAFEADPEPIIDLEAYLVQNPLLTPHISVINSGPGVAAQVKVQLIIRTIVGPMAEGIIGGHASSRKLRSFLPELRPGSQATIPVSLDEIDRLLPDCDKALELHLEYRKATDLNKPYPFRAFYLRNPQGYWVPEYESSVKGEPYDTLRRALALKPVPFEDASVRPTFLRKFLYPADSSGSNALAS